MAETHPGVVSGAAAAPGSGSGSGSGFGSGFGSKSGSGSGSGFGLGSGTAGDAGGSRSGARGATAEPALRAAAPPHADRTWTVLIAALGGEGGGVLSSWLVDAAAADGRRVQATSVPGVAQRTGATTYYLEIGPRGSGEQAGGNGTGAGTGGMGEEGGGNGACAGIGAVAEPEPGLRDEPSARKPGFGAGAGDEPSVREADPGAGSAGPVMALLPTPGNVDLLVASELLEAGRAARTGMITPDRTTVIASTHRTFAIAEKSAMGDGRFDDERIRRAVRELSRRHVLTDLGQVAERAGTVVSSVLLGAVAGSGALPIPRERLRAAIERAGIAIEANLRGFDAGCRLFDAADPEATAAAGVPDAADSEAMPAAGAPDAAQVPAEMQPGAASTRIPDSLAARVETLPEPVRGLARLGVARTVDYQDARYAALYLDRIVRMQAQADSAGVATEDAHAVGREVARQLALWMCFEDIVRVADLKTRRSRIERVRSEARAKPGQPVVITEFLKPGVDEWCSLLPAWLARPILSAAERRGWRRRLNVGLHVRTSTIAGFLLLWTLARLRPFRRGMHRYREEQARIETWLERVREAHATSAALALEAAKCASLVKGYGETRERGVRSFERTMACIGACAGTVDPAASLRSLREAALADPDGVRLEAAVAALGVDAPLPASG